MTFTKDDLAAIAARVEESHKGMNTRLAFETLALEVDGLSKMAKVAISALLAECISVGQEGVLADSRKNRKWATETFELLADECAGFVVRYDVEDYFVNFEVFGIVTTVNGVREFHRRGANDGMDTTPVLDDADVEMHGMIKWDGCSSVSYPASYDCMQHLCGRGDWEEWGKLYMALYDALTSKIPNYDARSAG
jgi:hypothetical protein